mmetsp:Transcript_12384/g.37783  ORF Transcript_12384/g.37783 Transcript_12384/m.37783 type:complete len:451 (+) Transcript_12384:66-1418(+)
MVSLLRWWRRKKEKDVRCAWDVEWSMPCGRENEEDEQSVEVWLPASEPPREVDGEEDLLDNVRFSDEVDEGCKNQVVFSREQLGKFESLLNAWEAYVRDQPSTSLQSDNSLDGSAAASVAEVRWLLQRLAGTDDAKAHFSRRQLSEFQRMLLNWEEYVRRDRTEDVPKSYTRPAAVGEVYYGIHGENTDESRTAAAAARRAHDHIALVSSSPVLEDSYASAVSQACSSERQHEEAQQAASVSVDSDSIGVYLPEHVIMGGETLNNMWETGLQNRNAPPKPRRASAEQPAPAGKKTPEVAGARSESDRYLHRRTWRSRLRLHKGTTRLAIRRMFQGHRHDERQTRFIHPLPLNETRGVAMSVLFDMGVTSLVLRNGGRKLKIQLPTYQGGHTLAATVHLQPMTRDTTRVCFLRSKDDGGRTPSSDFLRIYNAMYLEFLRLSRAEYDRVYKN